MAVCDFCKNRFDEAEAKVEFERLTWRLSYDKLRKCLCASCAVQAVENRTEGVYFDTCGKCGREFDLAVDECDFEHGLHGVHHDKHLRDFWDEGPRCCDCASELHYTRG